MLPRRNRNSLEALLFERTILIQMLQQPIRRKRIPSAITLDMWMNPSRKAWRSSDIFGSRRISIPLCCSWRWMEMKLLVTIQILELRVHSKSSPFGKPVSPRFCSGLAILPVRKNLEVADLSALQDDGLLLPYADVLQDVRPRNPGI